MKISKQMIADLKPCKSRFDNFVVNYPDFMGTHSDFLSLENITYDDKIWVMTRLMTMMQKRQFALACAQSVLDIFEKKRPGDDRVRKCLEATANYLDGNITVEELREARRDADAAYDAAYASYAAYAAAYDAYAYYVCSTAYAVCSAAYASYDADPAYVTIYTVCAAAYASYAADARADQQDLNLLLLNDVINESKEAV
jgi:hypothetical protein